MRFVFDDPFQNLFFDRISIPNLFSNLIEKSTFMTIQQIVISKLNPTAKTTSKTYFSLILEFLRILDLELLTVVVDII